MADSHIPRLLDGHHGMYLIKDTLQLSGRFVAMQCLMHLIKQQVQGLNPTALLQSGQLCVLNVPNVADGASVPSALLQELQAALSGSSQSCWLGAAVIVDDASVLAGLATDQQEWSHFLTGCRHLAYSVKGPYWLLLVAHEDIQQDTWLTLLEHHCEVAVQVEAIPGGMADIHGQATFTIRGASSAMRALHPAAAADAPGTGPLGRYLPVMRLFFRVGDTAVRWVPQPSVHSS